MVSHAAKATCTTRARPLKYFECTASTLLRTPVVSPRGVRRMRAYAHEHDLVGFLVAPPQSMAFRGAARALDAGGPLPLRPGRATSAEVVALAQREFRRGHRRHVPRDPVGTGRVRHGVLQRSH